MALCWGRPRASQVMDLPWMDLAGVRFEQVGAPSCGVVTHALRAARREFSLQEGTRSPLCRAAGQLGRAHGPAAGCAFSCRAAAAADALCVVSFPRRSAWCAWH